MFLKPFKVKSNSQLRGTERKNFAEDVARTFPILSDVDIQNLISKKESITVMKIVTHNDEICKLYCIAKIPMFFQCNRLDTYLFPTIFTLWQFPNLLYAFTTHRPVIAKLVNGANLMLPGVILNGPRTLRSYGELKKHTAVSVNTEDNKAAVAVGLTFHSSEDMYMSAGHGKCVDVLHVIDDGLCQLGKNPVIRPELGPAFHTSEATKVDDLEKQVEVTTISEQTELSNVQTAEEDSNEILDGCKDEVEPVSESPAPSDPVEKMDELLEYSFLKACKMIKPPELPILSSNFFKNHLIPACPPDQPLDIKKSSYKKLSVFLAKMKSKQVIDTTVIKGVESIVFIQTENPLLKQLVIKEKAEKLPQGPSNALVVSDCYKVTADVTPILSQFGYTRGDMMRRADIRNCFTEYVKRENLQDGKTLKLNPQLAGIFKTAEHIVTLSMEDGINKFIGRMTHAHEITVDGVTLLRVGKLEPIDITVVTRCNNKKVTLINNLQQWGIKLDEFSKQCQGIGASATITDVPGKKTPSVLVQGNQVLYVYKLLTENYNIKKTYIQGMQYAPKKRK